MASSYSTSLKLELIGNGDQSGVWGNTTNNNIGTLLEQAITGVQTITMSDANYTLSNLNGTVDEARNAVLVVTGTNSGIRQVVAPLVQKLYTIFNNTTGGYSITVGAFSGAVVTVPNGATAQVYCDGINFYTGMSGVTGGFNVAGNLATQSNLSVVGNSTLGGTLGVTGNATLGGTLGVTGNATLGGTLGVTGNAAMAGNLAVTGSITAGSITGITGRIVQTAQSVYTTTVGYSGGSDYPTGHTVSITPTSSSSTFLVMLTASLAQSNFGFALNSYLTMVRNGSNLTGGLPVDLSVSCQGGVNANFYGTVSYQFLDSPGTTSTITYQPYINTSGYVVYNNQQRAILTVLEIL